MKTLWTLTLAAALLVGCGGTDVETADTGTTASTTETSLSGDVMPVMQSNCAGCHTRASAPFPEAVVNGAYYETGDDLLALIGTFIAPGDSANSGFIAVLTQDFPVGVGPTVMPPPDLASAMAADDVATVAAWIDEGALNN